MKVHVRLMGMFRIAAGKPEDTIEFSDGATVRQLLSALTEKYGISFANQLTDEFGRVSPSCQIFVGGEPVLSSELDRALTGERVTLFFVTGMAGGRT